MMRHALATTILLATLLPRAALAQAQQADKCGPLKILSTIQMTRNADGTRAYVPITIHEANLTPVLDTGAAATILSMAAVDKARLQVEPSNQRLYGVAGDTNAGMVEAPDITLGQLRGGASKFPVMLVGGDGLFGFDYIATNDADLDFGSDVYKVISPDHCPGHVLYWQAAAVGTAPISLVTGHISVDIELDGQEMDAIIDTGAPETTLRQDIAERSYGITLGAADTPELPRGLNGHADQKTYSHIFKGLNFGGVEVRNPKLMLIPDTLSKVTHGLKSGAKLIIGMDVLRNLHVYFAFHERRMYVTAASAATAEEIKARTVPALSDEDRRADVLRQTQGYIRYLANISPSSPPPAISAALCWWRSTIKMDMDGTLELCDRAVQSHANTPVALSYRCFARYQAARYKDALDDCDASLTSDRKDLVISYLIRGYIKGRLGDEDGKKTDVAAALAIDDSIEKRYLDYGIGDDPPNAATATDAPKTP